MGHDGKPSTVRARKAPARQPPPPSANHSAGGYETGVAWGVGRGREGREEGGVGGGSKSARESARRVLPSAERSPYVPSQPASRQ